MAEKRSRSSLDLVPIVSILPEPPQAEEAGAICIKRDGSAIMILRVQPVDFEMRSQDEQEGILATWAEMLDGLEEDSPLQIVCHNKKLDAETYLRQFEKRLQDPNLPELHRKLINAQLRHFQQQILDNTMVQKEYYIVISFGHRGKAILESSSENMPGGIFMKRIQENNARKTVNEPDPEMLQIVRFELDSRVSGIQYYLKRMGCESDRLKETDIRLLYSELFHPELSEKQKPITPQRGRQRSVTGRADIEAIRRRRQQIAEQRDSETAFDDSTPGQLPPSQRRALPPSQRPQNNNMPDGDDNFQPPNFG